MTRDEYMDLNRGRRDLNLPPHMFLMLPDIKLKEAATVDQLVTIATTALLTREPFWEIANRVIPGTIGDFSGFSAFTRHFDGVNSPPK